MDIAGGKVGAEGVEDVVFAGAGDLELGEPPRDLVDLGGFILDLDLLLLVVVLGGGSEAREEGFRGEGPVLGERSANVSSG